MEYLKKSFLQVLKQQRIQEYGGDLTTVIFSLIEKMSFIEWWNSTLHVDIEDMVNLEKMGYISANNKENLNSAQILSEMTDGIALCDSVKNTKEYCDAFGYSYEDDFSFFRKEKLGNLSSERILSGKRMRKIDEQTAIYVNKFLFWLTLNVMIPKIKINNRKMEEAGDSLKKLHENARESILSNMGTVLTHNLGNELENQIFKNKDFYNSCRNLSNVARQLPLKDPEKNQKIILHHLKEYGRWLEERLKWMATNLRTLFLSLNSPFFPLWLRMEIELKIRESPLRKVIQNEYDSFKMLCPEAMNFRFYLPKKKSANNILSEDFEKETYGSLGMHLRLERNAISQLFSLLIKKGYLSPDTDINDFAYALTSKPKSQEFLFTPIDWIGTKKQSLAIFLGLLRPRDDGWYWSRSTKAFLFRGTIFTASQLSTPFGKMIKHPKTRQNEWAELEEIIRMAKL